MVAAQCETSAVVQAAHAPLGRQIGAAAPHSALEAQARQDREAPSQTGLTPPHSPFVTQPTQVPELVSHTGVASLHRVAFVAEHWPQAPVGSHAGDIPPQSVSAAQPRQAWNVGSQTGFIPVQAALSRHSTQTPAGV